MVTEREEQDYDNYRSAENSSLANDVLREISKKPMNLIEGALVVPERQIWQLLAPEDGIPRVKVVIDNKPYYVDYTSDEGAEHKQITSRLLQEQAHGISLQQRHLLMI